MSVLSLDFLRSTPLLCTLALSNRTDGYASNGGSADGASSGSGIPGWLNERAASGPGDKSTCRPLNADLLDSFAVRTAACRLSKGAGRCAGDW